MKLISALNVACHIQSLTLVQTMYAEKNEKNSPLQLVFDEGLLKEYRIFRKQPYFGHSKPQTAVSVFRTKRRPYY